MINPILKKSNVCFFIHRRSLVTGIFLLKNPATPSRARRAPTFKSSPNRYKKDAVKRPFYICAREKT